MTSHYKITKSSLELFKSSRVFISLLSYRIQSRWFDAPMARVASRRVGRLLKPLGSIGNKFINQYWVQMLLSKSRSYIIFPSTFNPWTQIAVLEIDHLLQAKEI